jgi:hypothetical protein
MDMNPQERLEQASEQVREDMKRIVEGFDAQAISKRLEEFGRKNPVGLALTALAFGVAVGLIMRGSKNFDIERK